MNFSTPVVKKVEATSVATDGVQEPDNLARLVADDSVVLGIPDNGDCIVDQREDWHEHPLLHSSVDSGHPVLTGVPSVVLCITPAYPPQR